MLPPRARIGLLSLSLFAVVACTLPPSPFPRFDAPDAPVDATAARDAAKSVNAFATDLYAKLSSRPGNLIFSPYSVGTALAMTATGAEGSTRDEMVKVLHLPDAEKVAPSYRAMTAGVTAPPQHAKHRTELSVANALWLQKGHPWKKEFLASGREDFRAGLYEVDFVGEPEAARVRINRWVEKETKNRIKDLVPPGAVVPATRIVLANAIYFKARWAESFKKEDTKPEDFTLASGQKVQTPLMYQKGEFWLWEDDDLQVLKLPYDGRDTSMWVFLPRKHDGLAALEQKLTAENLWRWTLGPLKSPLVEVKVWLPRFKFTVATELGDVLQKMGMREAFDGSRANFRAMTDHPEGVVVSRVIHKAFVETDEVGTEAAAATAVALAGRAASQPGPQFKEFRADRPFLFVIKHEPTGAVLFLGRVLDPTKP